MAITSAIIETDKLSKRYAGAEIDAVSNLSINVKTGEIYGFLGPNGAGKSTTIRLLLNFIQPTSGRAKIKGLDTVNDSVVIKHGIGYLAGDVALYGKMTGRQFLNYMAELHPLRHKAYLKKLTNAFEADLSVPINALSKGNRQKVGVIQALMHEPDLLILDEPTGGLDPLMQEVFYELINEAKKRGAAAFVSSHNLAEVQKMCDRVGIIKAGILVEESSISDMKLAVSQTFNIDFKNQPPLTQLRSAYGKQAVVANGNRITIHAAGELTPLFELLAKHPVKSISTRELNLEEEFMRFYGETKP